LLRRAGGDLCGLDSRLPVQAIAAHISLVGRVTPTRQPNPKTEAGPVGIMRSLSICQA
jgi:hypothetical protein